MNHFKTVPDTPNHDLRQLRRVGWSIITYIIINQGKPAYLSELIHRYTSSRNTRCSIPKLKFLHIATFDHTVCKSNKQLINSFSHLCPSSLDFFPFQIRNNPSVTSFRKHLKTHLLNSSFPTWSPSLWSHQ